MWLQEINNRLNVLRGSTSTVLEEPYIQVEFCNGHGICKETIADLRLYARGLSYELEASSLNNEDGQPARVLAKFAELYSWLVNAKRVWEER